MQTSVFGILYLLARTAGSVTPAAAQTSLTQQSQWARLGTAPSEQRFPHLYQGRLSERFPILQGCSKDKQIEVWELFINHDKERIINNWKKRKTEDKDFW